MTESAAILELRHCRVAEQATLRPAALSEDEPGVFVAVDDPPPVRTVVTVVEGDQRRALQVARVVEVPERDEHGTRGFYGRWVDDEALARASKVGTEHLEDGTPVVQPVVHDDSVAMHGSDAPVMGMAAPAPVLIVEDDTGVIDVGDDDDSEDTDEGAGEDAVAAADDEAAADSESADGGASDDGEAAAADSEASADDGVTAAADGEASADGDGEAAAADGEAAPEGEAGAANDEAAEASASSESEAPNDDGSGKGRRRGRKKRKRR